jgi:hypothetical protein
MNKLAHTIPVLLLVVHVAIGGINEDKEKATELKKSMWFSIDTDFSLSNVPEKWKSEQAVIIAKAMTFSYYKEPIVSNLHYNRTLHYRVKMQSARAIEIYSQFRLNGSRSNFGVSTKMYAGFKIIKPDGRTIEIPVSGASKETESVNDAEFESYKLAIPNLEIGDIIDYYIASLTTITIGQVKYHTFDPVVLPLNNSFPTMRTKISFDVLRRCYINLKSLNGAPQFKLSEVDDNNRYSLEASDLESAPESSWILPLRQLPAVKFKVTYASAFVAGMIPGFIGDPGKIKSTVGIKEICTLMESVYGHEGASNLKSYMKKNFKHLTNQDEIARTAYYAYRNTNAVAWAEQALMRGREPNPDRASYRMMIALSTFYKANKIQHDVLIGIPRQVSSLEDLVYEDELTLMLKVNTPHPFYVGRMDNNSMIDEIDPNLEGEIVYSGNGMLAPEYWRLIKVDVPVTDPSTNMTHTSYKTTITDLSEGAADLMGHVTARGISRTALQDKYMDFYDYREEETKRFKLTGPEALNPSNRAIYDKLQKDYHSSKAENLNKRLKANLTEDFEFTIEEANGIKIEKSGRFDDSPEFAYSFDAKVKGLTHRVGPNYLLDIGKLIEKQTRIAKEEITEGFDFYLPSPHTLNYTVEVQVPDGFTAKGIESLTTHVDNVVGRFASKAEMNGKTMVIHATNTYKRNHVDKSEWPLLLAFIQAGVDFNSKQILLEKN